jgi:hypothetical protein
LFSRLGDGSCLKIFHRPLQLSKFGGQRSSHLHFTITIVWTWKCLKSSKQQGCLSSTPTSAQIMWSYVETGQLRKYLISHFQAINNVFV